MIVAFTGHRPNKLGGYKLPNPIYNYVYGQIQDTLAFLKPTKVISGMALGIDQWAAMIAVRMNIPLLAAIPFEGQQSNWPTESQKLFNKLISLASEKVIVSEGGYTAAKMQIRNEWMTNNCDTLIAVYNGDLSGGTSNCVNYAKKLNKKIIYIDPTP
jgi:uncharacterized phage-like protein YoqJ